MFNKLKALILLLSFLTVIACSNDNSVLARDEKVTTASNHERDVQEMYHNIDTLKRELPSVIDEVIPNPTIKVAPKHEQLTTESSVAV